MSNPPPRRTAAAAPAGAPNFFALATNELVVTAMSIPSLRFEVELTVDVLRTSRRGTKRPAALNWNSDSQALVSKSAASRYTRFLPDSEPCPYPVLRRRLSSVARRLRLHHSMNWRRHSPQPGRSPSLPRALLAMHSAPAIDRHLLDSRGRPSDSPLRSAECPLPRSRSSGLDASSSSSRLCKEGSAPRPSPARLYNPRAKSSLRRRLRVPIAQPTPAAAQPTFLRSSARGRTQPAAEPAPFPPSPQPARSPTCQASRQRQPCLIPACAAEFHAPDARVRSASAMLPGSMPPRSAPGFAQQDWPGTPHTRAAPS